MPLPRPCEHCGKKFCPSSRWNRVCLGCRAKSNRNRVANIIKSKSLEKEGGLGDEEDG